MPPLGLSELRPPEYTEAKVYGGRVKGVHVALDIDLEIVTVTAFPGLAYQNVGELLEDPAVPFRIGLAEVAPGHGGPEAQMVELGAVRLEAQHQVPHAVPCGQLAEDHAQHLVPTGKAPDVPVAAVFPYDTVEYPAGQELGKLRENIFALIHGFFCKNPLSGSNRHAIKNRHRYDIQRISKNLV